MTDHIFSTGHWDDPSQMKTLLTYKDHLSTFIKTDLDILETFSQVDKFRFRGIKRSWHIVEFFRQFFHLLTHRYDLYYCYFSDYHSFLPVIFAAIHRKQSIIVAAGFDGYGDSPTDRYLHYGIWQAARWRRFFAYYAFKLSTNVLAASKEIQKNLKNQGIDSDIVHLATNVTQRPRRKRLQVMTVGLASDRANFLRKGYDRIYDIAMMLPDVEFICVGENFIHSIPVNVTRYWKLPHYLVQRLMSESAIYIQLSRIEGFGIALVESMRCGCHPIVSTAGMMPEIVGDAGFVSDDQDQIAAEIIRMAKQGEPSYYSLDALDRSQQFTVMSRMSRIISILSPKIKDGCK